MNKVILTGRTTADIEIRTTQTGKMVTNFTLAVNKKDDADFFTCVAWGNTADLLAKYVNKGDKIGIVGRLQARTYDDKDGRKCYVTEVVADEVEFLEKKRQEQKPEAQPADTWGSELRDEFVPF